MIIGHEQTVLLGPPGTGKTTDLINRVQLALESGIAPEEIAFVSFTKKAVQEAAERACAKFGFRRNRFPLFQTVHSLCFRQLGCSKQNMLGRQDFLELGEYLGYDMSGQHDMGDGILQSGAAPGDALLFLDNIARVRCVPLREVWEDIGQGYDIAWHELERFGAGYARFRERKGLMDFTDLLHRFVESGNPTKARIAFIDEAQDLSRAQWLVLERCFADVETVIVAGDDDQSIFKWSGADLDTFLTLGGEKIVLSQSYRLPKAIHKMSVDIIKGVKNRYEKKFAPTEKEGRIDYVGSLEQLTIGDDESTLILVRNVYLLKDVYEHVKRLGHTYTGRNGLRSVATGHVAAIVAWEQLRKGLRISLSSARDVYECMTVGAYLGRGGKSKLEATEDEGQGISLDDLKTNYALREAPVWHEALTGISLETREYYISVLRSGRKISHEPKIHINTIHGVKGGEADHVIVLSDMSKRTFQEWQKDSDSEARVAYVAVTRARQKLTIVMPRGRYAYNY